MSDWHRIGSPGHPVFVRDFAGGTATVARGDGGRWRYEMTLRGSAGDDKKAKAAVEAVVKVLAEVENQ